MRAEDGGRELDDAEQAELMVWLARAVNHPGRMGPYTTPLASTNDPLFWVVHANLDRVHAWMRANPDPTSRAATFAKATSRCPHPLPVRQACFFFLSSTPELLRCGGLYDLCKSKK